MKTVVYVEGGGDTKALRTDCRRGFRKSFEKAGLKDRMPRISACGSRNHAYDDFRHALDKAKQGEFIALLVDSEGPIATHSTPWSHLRECDKWEKPPGATNDNVHLMVQCMEAWLLADKDMLANYFGVGFNRNALPGRLDIENIPKGDLGKGLSRATQNCQKKGEYHKGRHSFEILAKLNAERVIAASRHAKRLVETLLNKV